MHLPNSFAINSIPSAGRGSAQIGKLVLALLPYTRTYAGHTLEGWRGKTKASMRAQEKERAGMYPAPCSCDARFFSSVEYISVVVM